MTSLLEILATTGLKAFLGAAVGEWRKRSTYRATKRACAEWCDELPKGLQCPVVEMFIDPGGAIFGLGRNRTLVRSSLREKRIPASETWALALLERWADLKSGLKLEAAERGLHFDSLSVEILQLSQTEVVPYFRNLGARLSEVYALDEAHNRRESLFVLKALEEKFLVQGPSSVADLVSTIEVSNTIAIQDESPSTNLETRLIDNACEWLKMGDGERAVSALETIKERDWGTLSSHGKFRVEANIGNALLLQGRRSDASARYLAASRHSPLSEPAKALEALALYLVDDLPAALRAAELTLEEFPNSSRSHMVRIRSTPSGVSVSVLSDN